MQSNFSTHVLDSSIGKPAAGIGVQLSEAISGEVIASAETNSDGRVSQWSQTPMLTAGQYRLKFDVVSYFAASNTPAFYPEVVIHFTITDADQHYHVPLLLSPFAYSTYRGS